MENVQILLFRFCIAQSCTRAGPARPAGRLFLSARGPYGSNIIVCGLRGRKLGRTPRDDNRDDVFNCHEVPIKKYLRKWNFASFHLFVFTETLP